MGGTSDLKCLCRVFQGYTYDGPGYVYLLWLMPLLGINSTITQAAYFILSINTGAYMAETVRGGILSIDPGQTEGAKSIGMTHVQTMIYVILPQALRNLMPQIGNNYIINVKDTSVMFIIGFTEFFAQHRYIVGVNNMYFPSATIEMIGYLTLTLIASLILRLVESSWTAPTAMSWLREISW